MNGKIIGAGVLAIVLVWFLVGKGPSTGALTEPEDGSSEKEARSGETRFFIGGVELSHPAEIDEQNEDHRFTRFRDGVSFWHHSVKLSGMLHRPDQEAQRDLEIIKEILGAYRLVFQENPVGTDNEEFTAALAGENPKKVVFIDPGLLVNGELLDRYGFPYYFHPLSAELMGLRSRGRDGELWTADDVILDPEMKDGSSVANGE